VGFACYEATCRNFFGPELVHPERRQRGIGRALLLSALHAMRAEGYAYAIIGWASSVDFYRRAVGAFEHGRHDVEFEIGKRLNSQAPPVPSINAVRRTRPFSFIGGLPFREGSRYRLPGDQRTRTGVARESVNHRCAAESSDLNLKEVR